jgi:hypothetical protein
MIATLQTLLAMAVTGTTVLLLGQIGPALGWPAPASLALPAAVFLALGVATASAPKGRRHG